MTLTPTKIPVAFSGGLDQKRPAKLSIPGRFLALENCVRRKDSLVEKRYGIESLSNTILGSSSTVDSGKYLARFKDDVILFDDTNLYSYAPGAESWIDKGQLAVASVDVQSLVRTSTTQALPDIAINSGFVACTYADSRGGVRCSIYDEDTGAALIFDQELASSGAYPKVVAVGDYFIFTYIESTTLKCKRVSKTTPTTIGSAQSIQASTLSAPYDIEVLDQAAVFATLNTSGGLDVGYITEAGTVGSPGANGYPAVVTTASAGSTGFTAINVAVDSTRSLIYVTYHDTSVSDDLITKAYTADLVTSATSTLATSASIRNVTGVVCADNTAEIYWEIAGSTVRDHYIEKRILTWAGSGAITAGSATTFKRSVGLATKAFRVSSNRYVIVSHDSSLQPAYFLVRHDGQIVAKMAWLKGGGHSKNASGTLTTGLGRVQIDSDSNYLAPIRVRNRVQADNDGKVLATSIGINGVTIDFSPTYHGSVLGQNYHVAGGFLQIYDGQAISEHSYHVFPEGVTGVVAGGGSLSAGDHSYRVVYEWTDAKGQVHRSAPSTTLTKTAANNDQITLTIPTLRLTAKAGQVNIVVYAAANTLSAVYYRHTTTANDATVDTVSVAITTEATTTNETLYTTGGILENIAAPACTAVHEYRNRLWIAGLEDDEIWYSKEWVRDEGVAFTDLFRMPLEAEGGKTRAYATLDEKLLIFKKDRTYFLSGEGPNDSGTQNDYGRPQLVAVDVGTDNPNSVAAIPQGVMFKSDKGFYMIDRRLSVRYIGAPVEDFNSYTVTSAVVLEDVNEVRFTTSEGVCLVYNYDFNQWSTFTNYAAVSACNGLDTYLHLKSSGTVNQETAGEYEDNGARYSMVIETAWMAFAGIQGFQRIYELELLGDFVSHHYTKLSIAYDYENAYNQTVYFNTQTGQVSTSVYGEGATYGDATPYGGSGSEVYQLRFQPQRQKCQSIKLRIEDVDTIGTNGGGSVKFVALTCEVGRKNGLNRLPGTKSVG